MALAVFGAEKYDCSKRYCKQMASCAEAYHYLNNCNRSSFDRDGDGVPCENVCKDRKKK
ncbi:excalibur calcium-binding domain-containing protein [Campylobacter anatolicus]|nr:excalibur calcium-binding domain-containing protein [Campylobacter anatolicus]